MPVVVVGKLDKTIQNGTLKAGAVLTPLLFGMNAILT